MPQERPYGRAAIKEVASIQLIEMGKVVVTLGKAEVAGKVFGTEKVVAAGKVVESKRLVFDYIND